MASLLKRDVVIRTSSRKPLLGVQFSHFLPFQIISSNATVFYFDSIEKI